MLESSRTCQHASCVSRLVAQPAACDSTARDCRKNQKWFCVLKWASRCLERRGQVRCRQKGGNLTLGPRGTQQAFRELVEVRTPICMSHVTHHTSHVTHHTSHITRHTSHITRHTSHITHHTSHVTHHTSHSTHITMHTSDTCCVTRVVRVALLRAGRDKINASIRKYKRKAALNEVRTGVLAKHVGGLTQSDLFHISQGHGRDTWHNLLQ